MCVGAAKYKKIIITRNIWTNCVDDVKNIKNHTKDTTKNNTKDTIEEEVKETEYIVAHLIRDPDNEDPDKPVSFTLSVNQSIWQGTPYILSNTTTSTTTTTTTSTTTSTSTTSTTTINSQLNPNTCYYWIP